MLKKPITYTDYDGNQRTETYWFNLDEAEILELQVRFPGGMSAMLQKMVEEQDGAKILATIKEIIMRDYGKQTNKPKQDIDLQMLINKRILVESSVKQNGYFLLIPSEDNDMPFESQTDENVPY